MPRQLSLKENTAPAPVPTSLIVGRDQIPATLTPAEKLILRRHLEVNAGGFSFFFRDCPEVRRVLRIGGTD